MDFTLSEDQSALAELAAKILSDLCPPDALRAHEQRGDPVFEKAWATLAESGLLGIALPEAVDGGGYGILEAALVAEQIGRHVVPVPYLPTVAAAIALAGIDADAHGALLRQVAAGTAVVAVATEPGAITGGQPSTSADADGRLTGDRHSVVWAAQADHLLVDAATDDGTVGLYLVPAGPAVAIVPEDAMWGLPQATVELAGAAAIKVGDAADVVRLVEISTALSCAAVAGLCEGAIRITATYVSEREQFGVRIGTFQAVGQRMADAYIDTQGVHLTARQAAWRLGAGVPATEQLHIAKFWAADGGHRVAHAAQHLHGGIGMDVDYPIHRYFRWIKVMELQLGSGTEHLRSLGARLAAEPV
ncbi:MAG: acyl-CoA/acyl-ACP dehydrogenase [Acidimicrobiia bacterium]|nr:acyl-CoA/acyl-ACP dehydrogenase [Acidimicrobiia bacterium]